MPDNCSCVISSTSHEEFVFGSNNKKPDKERKYSKQFLEGAPNEIVPQLLFYELQDGFKTFSIKVTVVYANTVSSVWINNSLAQTVKSRKVLGWERNLVSLIFKLLLAFRKFQLTFTAFSSLLKQMIFSSPMKG